jgi:DNA-binding transcriptional LysR family regulator
MTLRQLEIFCAISETGGFHAAAQKLYLSQPSISQQMHSLEEELGQQLFLRSRRRRVQITEAGRLFREHSERILRICQMARAEIAALASEPTGQLRIGMARHHLSDMLPPVLATFHRQFPKMRVALVSGTSAQLLNYLRTDRLDLGLVSFPIETKDLDSEMLLTEELVLVVPKDSALGSKRSVEADVIGSLPLIIYDQNTNTRRQLDRYFREAGITPRIAFEVSGVETMKKMVMAGLGASILPASVVVDDARRRKLHYLSLEGRPLLRSVGFVTPLHQQFPRVVDSLRNLIRERITEIRLHLARRGLCPRSESLFPNRASAPNDPP